MQTRILYMTLATAGLLAACAGARPELSPRPLAGLADSAEYAAFDRPGALELRGQALLTTGTGEVKLAAGRLVTLDPATSYSIAWFRRYGADLRRFEDPGPDPRFSAARRTTVADARGRFRFGRLAPGVYLVRSSVIWEPEVADSGPQGGVVAALVTVGEEDRNEVVLYRLYTQGYARTLGVTILTDEQLAARPSRVVSRVQGTSCATGLSAASLTEFPAREELLLNAGRKNADAVAKVACRKKGVDLAQGCTSRIVCVGDAIVWM